LLWHNKTSFGKRADGILQTAKEAKKRKRSKKGKGRGEKKKKGGSGRILGEALAEKLMRGGIEEKKGGLRGWKGQCWQSGTAKKNLMGLVF